MAVKNTVAKAWSLTASFDGFKWSAYSAGDKPSGYQTSPTLISTDIISGSLTGGESNKGAYMSLFGYQFGRQANLGLSTGARVYMRDPLGDNLWHEVDNYRALIKSRVFDTHQVQQLIVQVGSLGGGITNGRALDIKVSVNGVDTNTLVGGFVVQPGRFFFVDNVVGSETTGRVDNIALPFRYAQFAVGGLNNFTGIWGTTTASGDTGLRAGDTIVFRAGTWVDVVGFNNRFVRFRSHTGTVPNGTIGNGYIHFVRYPGAIGANAPEVVVYNDPPGGGGAFQGVNTAYANTYGMYWSVSGFKMTGNATSTADAGMVNFQTGSHKARAFDCEAGPWPSTLPTAGNMNAKSGGIAGNGDGCVIQFNYIHDIACDVGNSASGLENHGIYADGTYNGGGYNSTAINWEVSYNKIENIVGGSGIQFYNSSANSPAAFVGMNVHHNWINGTAKYGMNAADYFKSGNFYCNVVQGTGAAGMRFNTSISNGLINVVHNLFYNNNTTGSGPAQGAANNDNTLSGTTTVNIQHNIFVLKEGRGGGRSSNDFITNNAPGTMIQKANLYYDPDGLRSAPGADSFSVTGNPLWTDAAAFNYTVQTGSPALGACTDAEFLAQAIDFYGILRPVTGTSAPGATKNDIGPFQGIGT